MLAVYCVINVVLQTFIQPRFVGDAVGISTLMTFVSLALWAYLLGALGALLAVPMSLLLRAFLVDADPNSAWSQVFFTSVSAKPKPAALPPAPPPASRILSLSRSPNPARASGRRPGSGRARRRPRTQR